MMPFSASRRASLLRLAIGAVAIFATASFATLAAAQTAPFPSRPVTLVNPYPAGGASDALMRPIAERLSRLWNQPVVVDNRTGANGIVATQYVMRAAPDGHTILVHLTGIIQNVSLYKNVGYDPFKDLVPLTQIGTQPMGLAVSPKSAYQSFAALAQAVKAHPADFSYGSFGNGSTGHIYGELLRTQLDVAIPHAPYRGEGPMLPDIIATRVAYGFVSAYTAAARAKDKTLSILAVTGPRRLATLPDVPTLAELGYKNFELVGWYGLFVPAGTPKAVGDRIAADVKSVLAQPDIQARMRDLVIEPTGTSPADFVRLMRSDYASWDALIKQFSIALD
jgi:tripartite-type tricarboxylate transporter receptor subunit TctC